MVTFINNQFGTFPIIPPIPPVPDAGLHGISGEQFIDILVNEQFTQGTTPLTRLQVKDLFAGYLVHLGTAPLPTPPTDWQSFSNQWKAWYSQYNTSTTNNPNLYQGFATGYLSAQNSALTNNVLTGDLAILNDPMKPPLNPPLDFSFPPTASNVLIPHFNQFISSFNWAQFVTNLPTHIQPILINANNRVIEDTNNAKGTVILGNFFSKFSLTSPTADAVLQPADPSSPFANLPSFESLFFSYGPPNTSRSDYIAALKTFYNNVSSVPSNPRFTPTAYLQSWIKFVQAVPTPSGGGSLDGNDSYKIQIINTILLLLIKIVNSMQQIGITQAQKLQYTTQFQQAYTALQIQVPTFLDSSPLPIGGSADDAQRARTDLNSAFNSILIDNLRTLRGLQEDTSKNIQSSINQTSDSTNQQVDMCTTFLQQLSSLLSTILR
ncbi:MAG: hypothetical protein H0W88_04100 [Parachlamydiaceae bacterium]|nr:hypothetical protein [Parachlamydiaceae bacterium]